MFHNVYNHFQNNAQDELFFFVICSLMLCYKMSPLEFMYQLSNIFHDFN